MDRKAVLALRVIRLQAHTISIYRVHSENPRFYSLRQAWRGGHSNLQYVQVAQTARVDQGHFPITSFVAVCLEKIRWRSRQLERVLGIGTNWELWFARSAIQNHKSSTILLILGFNLASLVARLVVQ
jgi:hypothetical protein